MKIEKVNENQIRCTLTKQDLADRQINLRELAYGSEKAKGLFHDMIQQANYEFGFDVSDNPLMVEAIPLSSESLVLLITKVEYPEELDTRFSQFTEAGDEELFSNMGAAGKTGSFFSVVILPFRTICAWSGVARLVMMIRRRTGISRGCLIVAEFEKNIK